MSKMTVLSLLFASFAFSAQAHQMWLERGEAGQVRAYLGETIDEPDSGEIVANLVQTTELFTSDRTAPVSLVAKADHLEATVTGDGDVRLYNEQVWAPWKLDDGTYQAAAFQARAGRTETAPVFDLELVPVAAGSDTFTLMFKGAPVANADVTVISPAIWQKTLKTDAAGRVTVPIRETGRFVLVAEHEEKTQRAIAGQTIASLIHIASLSFVAE
jgi:hypothetical protein